MRRRFRRAPYRTAVIVAAVCCGTVPFAAQTWEPAVATIDDLRPRTAEERARAAEWEQRIPRAISRVAVSEMLSRGSGRLVGPGMPVVLPLPPAPGGLSPEEAEVWRKAAQVEFWRPRILEDVRSRTCAVEAVAIARPVRQRVLMTSSETWLFTDYTVAVERWIRGGSADPSITFSALGGSVRVGGKSVFTVIGTDRDPIRPNEPYLMFLDENPQMFSYTLTEHHLMSKPSITPIAGALVAFKPDEYVKLVTDFAAQCDSPR